MPVRGLGLALALGKRNEIRNFIGCREINNADAGLTRELFVWYPAQNVNTEQSEDSHANRVIYLILGLELWLIKY
jgi:hypothetical protein